MHNVCVDNNSGKPDWASAVDRWIRTRPLVILLIVLAVVVSSLFTLIQGFDSAVDYYHDKFLWRGDEYAKIQQLRAGDSTDFLDDLLGPPLLVRKSKDQAYTERNYRERDYWVQAIADGVGTVKFLAITACDSSFQPTITSPISTVTLNRSTFTSIGTPRKLRYHSSAGSLGTWFDEYGPGNPAFYKSYFFGLSDACPMVAFAYDYIERSLHSVAGQDGVEFDASNTAVEDFRRNSIINTYAETDVDTDPSPILAQFTIGVWYVNARVVDFER